jgi:hypothetical protein
MPFGYIGQNQTKQQVKNSGVLSSFDISLLEKEGQAGGSLELLTTQTVTSMTSAIDFTNVFTDKYDVYFLETKNVQSDTTGYTTGIQFYESGVLESAGVYQYGLQSGRATGSFNEGRSTTESWIHIGADTDNTTANSSNSYTYIYNPTNSAKYTFLTMQGTGQFGTTYAMRFGGGVLPQASTVDGFRLRSTYTTGQITGEFFLYGVKQI